MATGELTDGQLLVAAGDDDKVQLVLAGATVHNEDGPAIYVQNADKCFVTLADGAENTLTDGADYALEADSDEPYATLFSRCDLTLNGGGTLNVTAAYRHAVCSKDDLTVVSGTYNISAVEDGLRGRDSVKIRDGAFAIAAGGDGIKSNKDSKPTKGFVSIDGGTFDIQAGAGAAANADSATAGNAASAGDAARGQRGQGSNAPTPPDDSEAAANDGAPDNAFAEGAGQGGKGGQGGGMTMGDENRLIQINGGYLVVDAAGDGVDSNGSVEVNDGVLLVAGPTSSGDGAFDYDLTATVNGGTVLMVGSTGMAQNFTSGTQAFAMAATSGTAGQTVAVLDASGSVVASFTAPKQFGMVLASCPAFAEGDEYSLVVGGSVEGANADGYADSGTVSGGSETAITASCTASSGLGGLDQGGGPMAAGQAGDVRVQRR